MHLIEERNILLAVGLQISARISELVENIHLPLVCIMLDNSLLSVYRLHAHV